MSRPNRPERPATAATDRDVARARRLALYAVRTGQPVTSCPFNPGGDVYQRQCASAWVRTYLHHQPPGPATVSYDDGDD